MNGRKAKALRRIAEDGSTGYPGVAFERVQTKPASPANPTKRRIQLADRCTRQLYQTLKMAVKRAGR
jgi:hypothetical protein